MSKIDQSDVAKIDSESLPMAEQKASAVAGPTETVVSLDLSVWKINIKGFFKRVTGRNQ